MRCGYGNEIERFGSATGAGLKLREHSMENPTENDRKPDNRAGCAVAVGSAPILPAEISRDGSEVWKWASDMGAWVQREARIAELRGAIRKCGAECGDCEKWMCSSLCPREQPGTGKRAGYSVGPSMSAPICGAYVEKPHTTKRRVEYTRELESLLPQNTEVSERPDART